MRYRLTAGLLNALKMGPLSPPSGRGEGKCIELPYTLTISRDSSLIYVYEEYLPGGPVQVLHTHSALARARAEGTRKCN